MEFELHELTTNELTSQFYKLIESKVDNAFLRSEIYDFIDELNRRDRNL